MKKIYVLLDERAWKNESSARVIDVADTMIEAFEIGLRFPKTYLWYEYEIDEIENLINGRPRIDLCPFQQNFIKLFLIRMIIYLKKMRRGPISPLN